MAAILLILSFCSAIAVQQLTNWLGFHGNVAVGIVQYGQAQFGFLALDIAYIYYCDTPSLYVRFRRPRAQAFLWLGGMLLLIPVLSTPRPNWYVTEALVTSPALWVVVFVFWFGISVPAEELLFRGIIQGRLREAFATPIAIPIAAVFFGLIHFLFTYFKSSHVSLSVFIITFTIGVCFGVAYELTENLAIVSFAHASFWISPVVLHLLNA
uniref:CPBP family intramembrane glutamic endopeptidase n=1 Tax=Halobacterium sp. (strain GN101) TaxID=88773 RepID=UPI00159EE2C2|nr:type II CAAX endopeptidase family protein [Halobacterium sp. GN101]